MTGYLCMSSNAWAIADTEAGAIKKARQHHTGKWSGVWLLYRLDGERAEYWVDEAGTISRKTGTPAPVLLKSRKGGVTTTHP